MRKKVKTSLLLVMAIVMMMLSSAKMWAGNVTITVLSGSPSNYADLFDGKTSNTWYGSSDNCYVIFKLSESKAMMGYTLVDGEDTDTYQGRHWKSWTIYGANFSSDEAATKDASEWVQVDSQSGSKYNSSSKQSSFTVSGANSYKYYKIEVNEVGETSFYWYGIGMINEKNKQEMAEMQFTWALSVGENLINIGKGETGIFRFTPATTGWYRFRSEGNSDMDIMDVTLNGETIYDLGKGQQLISSSNLNFDYSIELTAGNSYYINIIEANHNAVVDYKLYVEKIVTSDFIYTAPADFSDIFKMKFGTNKVICGNWTDSSIPVTVKVLDKVTKIPNSCFSYTVLTSIILPSSVESIGLGVFTSCTNLAKISFNSIPQVDASTFGSVSKECEFTLALTDDSYVAADKGSFPTLTDYPTYTRSIAAKNNWGTVVLPFEAKSDKVVQFYELTGVSSGTLTLSPVATVPANTPCLFKKKVANATSVTITANKYAAANAVPTTSAVGGLTLTGTYTASNVATGAGYVLDDDKFLMTATETKISPFRAYLAGSIDGVDTLTLPDNTTPGDLDDDSNITVVDLTLLIKLLNNSGTISNPAADVNGNGSITIDDVDALRNKVLEVK